MFCHFGYQLNVRNATQIKVLFTWIIEHIHIIVSPDLGSHALFYLSSCCPFSPITVCEWLNTHLKNVSTYSKSHIIPYFVWMGLRELLKWYYTFKLSISVISKLYKIDGSLVANDFTSSPPWPKYKQDCIRYSAKPTKLTLLV